MKIGGREWDPLLFNGLRYAGLVPILWAYTLYYYRANSMRLTIAKRDLLMMAVLGLMSAVGMEAVLSYGLQYSNTANGALLGRGFMPILTALFALLLKELRLSWRIVTGIPLAFAGVVFMVAGDGFHIGAETLRGDALLLMRSLVGACYLIWMNRLIQRYPLTLLITLEITFGAVSLLPFVLWKANGALFISMSVSGWMSLIYTALFATLVGFSLHNWSLGKLGPFKSSVYGYLLPVTAAIAGILLLRETITWNQWLGGAGVLIAMYLVQSDRMQQAKKLQSALPDRPPIRNERKGNYASLPIRRPTSSRR